MKKVLLILIFCLASTGASFAQNNAEAMRFLTINALMQYGHQLYDRGDYDEASAVFKHVLSYDNHQPQALQYLKDMGYSPQGVDFSNAQSLKKAIEDEKQVIKKLHGQIIQMRANIASQSVENQSN